MTLLKNCRWQKATDINREYVLFELVFDEKIVLDVGFTDMGNLEVVFHEGIVGLVIQWPLLQKLIEEGKTMAELDR